MPKDEIYLHNYDGLEVRYSSEREYNEIMSTIRGMDVDDILRDSPVFDEDCIICQFD